MNDSNQRRRIAIVVTSELTASTFVEGFAGFAAQQGNEVFVVADSIEPMRLSKGEGVLHQIPVSMAREPQPFQDLGSLFTLLRTLRRIDPEILVYATPKASLLASIAGFGLRIPIRIYQLWGLRLETTTGLKRRILGSLEWLTSRLSKVVLANSASLSNLYRSLGLNAGRRLEMIGHGSSHGVDTSYFSQYAVYSKMDHETASMLEDRRDEIKIGFVGRLHPDKGIHTLFKALDLIAETGTNATLILVGGDEGVELELKSNDAITKMVVGHVNDPRPYYAAMDVLVLPSLREGFPNVVLEAAAMSVPSIVSDGTGVVDSVVDGETGLVVPVEDAQELANALLRLIADEDLRTSLGVAARVRAQRDFEQKDVWESTLTHITGIQK